MKYCSNCGRPLKPGAKFCSNCGTKVNIPEETNVNPEMENKKAEEPTRQAFAGRVKKCPACGAEITALTAYCPVCGHEINSAEVSDAIKDFTNKINKCDVNIARSPADPKRGWSSWGILKKLGWIVLNIYTLGIPLIIYLLFPALGIGGMRSLTAEEKEKASMIKNYTFPSDRENILEALFFIRSQMESLASDKINRNTAHWIKIWRTKASQIYDKAQALLNGDEIASETYNDILQFEKKVKKTLLIRLVAAIAAIVLFVVLIFVWAGNSEPAQESNATFNWPTSGLALEVPEPLTNKGEIEDNDDEEFQVEVRGITEEDYNNYLQSCKDAGYTIESKKDSYSYQAYNEEGYHLELTHFSSSTNYTVEVTAPREMSTIVWPENKATKMIPIPSSDYGTILWEHEDAICAYLGNITKEEYKKYVDACIDAGFKDDYSRGDDYYYADGPKGFHVTVDYEGNKTIFIKVEKD